MIIVNAVNYILCKGTATQRNQSKKVFHSKSHATGIKYIHINKKLAKVEEGNNLQVQKWVAEATGVSVQ